MTAVRYPCLFWGGGGVLHFKNTLPDFQYTVTIVFKIYAWLNEISAIACTNSSIMWTSSTLLQQTFQAWQPIYKSQRASLNSLMMQHIHQSIMTILHSPVGIFLIGFCLISYKRNNEKRKKEKKSCNSLNSSRKFSRLRQEFNSGSAGGQVLGADTPYNPPSYSIGRYVFFSRNLSGLSGGPWYY